MHFKISPLLSSPLAPSIPHDRWLPAIRATTSARRRWRWTACTTDRWPRQRASARCFSLGGSGSICHRRARYRWIRRRWTSWAWIHSAMLSPVSLPSLPPAAAAINNARSQRDSGARISCRPDSAARICRRWARTLGWRPHDKPGARGPAAAPAAASDPLSPALSRRCVVATSPRRIQRLCPWWCPQMRCRTRCNILAGLDDFSVDRVVIAKILRNSKYRSVLCCYRIVRWLIAMFDHGGWLTRRFCQWICEWIMGFVICEWIIGAFGNFASVRFPFFFFCAENIFLGGWHLPRLIFIAKLLRRRGRPPAKFVLVWHPGTVRLWYVCI